MTRLFTPFVLSLLLLLVPDASLAKYKAAPVTGGGTITGKVSFQGAPPAPVKYIITKDHDACGKGRVTRQEVDAKDGALRGVVVYLHKVKKGKDYPEEIRSVVVDQKKCAYLPYLQAVAEGGKVTILNSDAAHHKKSKGSFTAVAMVTGAVRAGVTFAYFGFPENPANSVVHRVPDPLTNRYRYKLGKGRLKKIGESPHKHSLTSLSFVPRTL